MILSASILSADFRNLEQQVRAAEEAGIDWFHIDVMDGHFVPNISMGPFMIETMRKMTRLPLDVHLMISNPADHLNSFVHAGADYIGVHVENQPNLHRLVQSIHTQNCKATAVLNPGTPAGTLEAILPELDMVLVMSVNPGYSGQAFIPGVTPKIAAINKMILNAHLSTTIQVDGGITDVTLPQCHRAGADAFVSASYIFQHKAGIADAISRLRAAVHA